MTARVERIGGTVHLAHDDAAGLESMRGLTEPEEFASWLADYEDGRLLVVTIELVAEDLAAGEPLDRGLGLVAHGGLKLAAQVHDVLLTAAADQDALALGQRVLEHHDDHVVANERPRLRGTAAGVLADQSHHGVRDRG